MNIPKISKKYFVPVLLIILLLIGGLIYLSTKDKNKVNSPQNEVKQEDKKEEVQKTPIDVNTVVFNHPVSGKPDCAALLNSNMNITHDIEAEKRLNKLIEDTKKYISYAKKYVFYAFSAKPLIDTEIFLNDYKNSISYTPNRQNPEEIFTVVDAKAWKMKNGVISPFNLNLEKYAKLKEEEKPVTTLEYEVKLDERKVAFDSNAKDTTLIVSGNRTITQEGSTSVFKEVTIVKYKGDMLESIQNYSSQNYGDTEIGSTCDTILHTYANLGDTFVITAPQ